MPYVLSRRNLLRGSALSCGALLAGCAVSTTNGVTTITLNVATVDTYAKAVSLAGSVLLGLSVFTGPLGVAGTAAATVALAAVAKGISAFDVATAGQVSISFTSSSVPASLASVEADCMQFLTYVQEGVTAAGTSLPANVKPYIASLETIIPLLVALTSTIGAVPTPMTEKQALAVVGL